MTSEIRRPVERRTPALHTKICGGRAARFSILLLAFVFGARVSGTLALQDGKPAAPSGPRQPSARPAPQSSGPSANKPKSDVEGAAATSASDDPVAPLGGKVARIYAALENNYVAPVDPDQTLLDGAIRRALATLDPFSSFFDRDQFHQLHEQQQGQTLGFGSILYVQRGKAVVISAAEGTPAARAGLGPGDEIVAVNGTRLAGLDFQSMIGLLEKSRSGPVRLGVIHPGRVVSEDLSLKPAEVEQPS